MSPTVQRIGRYLLFAPIASGGMANVYVGRLEGPQGFRRPVAIKRMHVGFGRQTVIDEARLSSRVRHANVVQALDVVEHEGELVLVLEYVHGDSLDRLLEGGPVPPRIAAAIVSGALRGLHAAHEARGADGQPLELVHRDLSPHNILVDVNGVARVLDFGVARARGRLQATQDGQLKGKLAYLAPEQVHGDTSRRSDLFAAGVVLWECLTGRRLFQGVNEGDLLAKVLLCKVPTLASAGIDAAWLQPVLDHALDRDPARRFATAAEMADAIEASAVATPAEVSAWIQRLAAGRLAERARLLEQLELAPDAERRPATDRRLWLPAAAALAVLGLGAIALLTRPAFVPAPLVVVTPAPAPLPAPAPAPAPAPVVVTVAAPRRPAPVKKPAPAPAPDCEPPYTIDSAGVKRFKVECLR